MSIDKRVFWGDFIALYQSFPCLWDKRSKAYKERDEKNSALDILVKKYQELNPNANRELVGKKIHNFRCGFRRELNKVRMSQKISPDKPYVPSLWSYDALSFLSDTLCSRKRETFSDYDTEYEEVFLDGDDVEDGDNEDANDHLLEFKDLSQHLSTLSSPQSPTTFGVKRSKRKRGENDECGTQNPFTATGDYFDVTAKKIASDLRQLNEQQRIVAEKLISEVVFYGKLGKLTESIKIL